MSYRCEAHALSDVGRRRSENQDAWWFDARAGFFLVADGMGGMTAGGVAAAAAAKVLPKMVAEKIAALGRAAEKAVEAAIGRAITEFSASLRERAEGDPRLRGTGTTVVLAQVLGRCAYIANLGDSRAYLLKAGELRLLTEDHSVAGMLVKLGKLSHEDAREHPGRHTLTRCVGMEGKAVPDVRMIHLKGPCRILLCTDGLNGMISDESIRRILCAERDREAACARLVREANEAGGTDNVTAMVVDLELAPAGERA